MEDPNDNENLTPETIDSFINSNTWTYAKTMAWCPHEYIVRDRCSDLETFVKLVKHIRKYGYQQFFYKKEMTYFKIGNMKYWSMGAPVSETTIINRAFVE